MENKKLFALTAVGLVAAIAVPTIAFGNARPNPVAATSTPLVAQLIGANEVPIPGDTDGSGAAAITFDLVAVPPTVCWDFSFSGIATPITAAHIHPGVAGVANLPIITFTPATFGANSATGCKDLVGAEITAAPDVVANPANYYVNIHNADFGGGAARGQLASAPAPAGEAHLLPTPLRAYDSRDASGAKILAGETRTISLGTGHTLAAPTVRAIAVPPGATAAIVTLTVTETATGVGGNGGFLTMYNAALTTQPATSSINWAGVDQNVAVSTQVAVDASGSVKVAAGANATHFVIDVIGYLY